MNHLYHQYINYITKKADELWEAFNTEIEFESRHKLKRSNFDSDLIQLEAWKKVSKKLHDIQVEAEHRGCRDVDIKKAIWMIR